MRRVLGAALGSLAAGIVFGPALAAVPNVTCQLQRQTRIDPSTFASTISAHSETYRITNGKLYLSSPHRTEYFYNDVIEIEAGGRYLSGHKTLIFVRETSSRADRMLAFHADELDIRVSEFRCRGQ
jgi:hypothetical protein